MKMIFFAAAICMLQASSADVVLDQGILGKSLGGWDVKKKKAADYELSGSSYRTYRPEITPTPEGGIFVSVRIDYLRGMFASDDHATLEMTFDKNAALVSAQSSIAIQGRRVTSDLIRSGTEVGKSSGDIGTAVKMGGDLVASLTEKLSRENLVEAGRVTFPAAVRHNYNKIFQSVSFVKKGEGPLLDEKTPATPGADLDKNNPPKK